MLGPKFDVQGHPAAWTFEELKSIVSKMHLKIDDKFLQDQNVAKEDVLAQVKSTLNTTERNLEFAKLDSSHPIMQKNVEQAKISFLIRSALFKYLEKEAIELFQKVQKEQELRAALHSYIARIAEANYQKMIADTVAQQFAEQERDYEQMILSELDRMNREAQTEWDTHQRHIQHLDKKISDLRQERQQIWDKHLPNLVEAINNIDELSPLSNEQRAKIALEYSEKIQIRDQRISQGERKIALLENDISDLLKREQQCIDEIRAKDGPKIVSKQEQNKGDGVVIHQKNLQSKLSTIIDNNPEISEIRRQIAVKKEELNALKLQSTTYKKETSDDIFRQCVEKNVTPEQFKEIQPRLSDARKKFESTSAFVNAQKEMSEHNNNIATLKEEKEATVKKSKEVEKKIEIVNKQCEEKFNVSPTPSPGGFLARRKAMQNSV